MPKKKLKTESLETELADIKARKNLKRLTDFMIVKILPFNPNYKREDPTDWDTSSGMFKDPRCNNAFIGFRLHYLLPYARDLLSFRKEWDASFLRYPIAKNIHFVVTGPLGLQALHPLYISVTKKRVKAGINP